MKIGDFKIGDTLKCIKGGSHPNLGRMFTKGRQYKITDIVNERIAVENWYVDFEYILKHFIKEENNDDSKRR